MMKVDNDKIFTVTKRDDGFIDIGYVQRYSSPVRINFKLDSDNSDNVADNIYNDVELTEDFDLLKLLDIIQDDVIHDVCSKDNRRWIDGIHFDIMTGSDNLLKLCRGITGINTADITVKDGNNNDMYDVYLYNNYMGNTRHIDIIGADGDMLCSAGNGQLKMNMNKLSDDRSYFFNRGEFFKKLCTTFLNRDTPKTQDIAVDK